MMSGRILKVLTYEVGRTKDGRPQAQMRAIVEREEVFSISTDEVKAKLYDAVAQSEEPTAAMFVAATDSLFAQKKGDDAEQTARTAIRLSNGDKKVLLTLVTVLLRANRLDLAKRAFAAIDEEAVEIQSLPKKRKWFFRRPK